MLIFPLLLASACDRDDQKEIFPEEYFKVMYVRDAGSREVAMNTVQDVVTEQVVVVKSGSHPEMSAECTLEVMPAADAAIQMGYGEDEIAIIPEGSYRLPGSFTLTEKAPYRSLNVELIPALMVGAMRQKPDLQWVLPLRLVSDSGTVNKESGSVLFNCSVASPLIKWADDKAQAVSIDYKTLAFPVGLAITKTEINKTNVSGSIKALGEEAVAEYNTKHGTTFPLLPAASYTFGELSIAANNLSGSVQINLSRTGLTSDVEYLLPVCIESVSSDLFDLSEDVKYFIVSNPKFGFEDVDPTTLKIAFCNSEDRNSQYWASNMFNRDPKSNFCSYWNVSQQTKIGTDVDDFRYPVEGTYPGTCTYTSGRLANTTINVPYPCCDGVRKYDKVVVVIDLGEPISIHGIGLSKGAGNVGNLDLKGLEIYTEDQFTLETAAQYKDVDVTKYRAAIANYSTADDGNNWRLLMQWNDIPKGTTSEGLPTIWNTVPEDKMNTAVAKGRYLKLHPTASYRATTNCIEICDLYIKKLITIDGEPVL